MFASPGFERARSRGPSPVRRLVSSSVAPGIQIGRYRDCGDGMPSEREAVLREAALTATRYRAFLAKQRQQEQEWQHHQQQREAETGGLLAPQGTRTLGPRSGYYSAPSTPGKPWPLSRYFAASELIISISSQQGQGLGGGGRGGLGLELPSYSSSACLPSFSISETH